eukprot:CAMPEP_0201667760 /NCGR_PEP_ID=MMETSP0494-20130426/16606_1 /ASSEMBLY_ACC=CAM_ASM_000839 /TAXON_ID=420259 /ORGANISM="Thalassiosira gravida, Strain GMp14c1" /LENGTH=260 /DNA_ID=CAMNT_0048147893 /DNA_START=35 /DNA_END=817 /DNA_ORIENTATION=-
MPTLKKFLLSVEQKPSSIHGEGIFTKKAIKQGDYCSQSTQDIVNFVQEMTAVNSPVSPTWRDLLFIDDDGSNNDAEDMPLRERLENFRRNFANFIEEEKSKANMIESVVLSNGRPTEMHVNIIGTDIKRGRELLRAYGPEWLSVKYYHLKANLLTYRTKLNNGRRKFMVFIDPDELLLQDMTIWEDNEMGMGPVDAAKLLSEKKSSGNKNVLLRHVSLDELNSMANVLGMVAHENFGKGDWKFDSSWKNTQTQLKQAQQN